jgi:hypothetical protein
MFAKCRLGQWVEQSTSSHLWMTFPKRFGYVLKTKDRVLKVFKQFQVSVERKTEKKIKCLRTDNGGEYIGPFDAYCKEQGIRHQFTPPKTPQLNGLAERMNMTIMELDACCQVQSCQNIIGVKLCLLQFILSISNQ